MSLLDGAWHFTSYKAKAGLLWPCKKARLKNWDFILIKHYKQDPVSSAKHSVPLYILGYDTYQHLQQAARAVFLFLCHLWSVSQERQCPRTNKQITEMWANQYIKYTLKNYDLCVCGVYTCTCMYGWMDTRAHLCMEAKGPPSTIPQEQFSLFWDRVSHWSLTARPRD